jgi:hypothetical protein
LQVVVSLVVTLPPSAVVIVRDERRLTPLRLARAWPPASRDAAIFTLLQLGLPHLSIVIHFVRTRRTWLGFGLGLLWFAAVEAADFGAQLAAGALVDSLGL